MGMTVPAAYGGQGRSIHDVVLAVEQVARVLRRHRADPGGLESRAGWRDRPLRHRGAEAEVPAPRGPGGQARHRDHRARGRLGRLRPHDARRAGRRRVGPDRGEALDHRRGRLSDLRGLLPVRRHPGARRDRRADRRRRHAGPDRHPAGARDGDARHPRGRGRARSLPGARRESAPARGRLQTADVRLQRPAAGRRDGGARTRPGRARGRCPARGRARAVRPADRRSSRGFAG